MFALENQFDYSKFNNNITLEFFGNNQFEEKEAKPQYELYLNNAQDTPKDEDFTLFEGKLVSEYDFESGNLTPTKEQSSPSDDEAFSSHSTQQTHLQVDFEGENPNMDDFLYKIRGEISLKGVNEVVCDALDIKNGDEFSLEPVELIKVKKRKTKDQIRQLEEEFSKNDDWSKEFMNRLASKLNLEPSQVYKWHWDQISKKLGKAPKRQAKLRKQANKRKRAAKTASSRSKRARN